MKTIEESVEEAVSLLLSIGAEVCHPNYDYESLLPLCGNRPNLRQRFLEQHSFANLKEQEIFYTSNLIGCFLCISFVGLVAGLFLGYMTLDTLALQIMERASMDENERIYASTVLPIVQKKHLVLVTLLILNALAYEALPIFLDALVPSWLAILLSVTLILVFGEIIPCGIFTGSRQLYLAHTMAPLMYLFLWLLWPIAKPLALLLDFLTHDDQEDEGYHRGEISALLQIQHENENLKHLPKKLNKTGLPAAKFTAGRTAFHTNHYPTTTTIPNWLDLKTELMEHFRDNADEDQRSDDGCGMEQLVPPLDPMEVDLMEGALGMKTRHAMDVYTPLNNVYALADTLLMDRQGMADVYSHGFSRVPVYVTNPADPNDITQVRGFLMSRQLMLVDWDHCRPVKTLPLQRPVCVSPRMNLVDLIRLFQSGGYHMTFVCGRPDLANKAFDAEKSLPTEAGFMGLVTLADIIESILQDRIYDEVEIRDRERAVLTLTRWAATKLQTFYRKKKKGKRDSSLERPSVSTETAVNETAPLLSSSRTSNRLSYG
jgi:metal transporter CNNM